MDYFIPVCKASYEMLEGLFTRHAASSAVCVLYLLRAKALIVKKDYLKSHSVYKEAKIKERFLWTKEACNQLQIWPHGLAFNEHYALINCFLRT